LINIKAAAGDGMKKKVGELKTILMKAKYCRTKKIAFKGSGLF